LADVSPFWATSGLRPQVPAAPQDAEPLTSYLPKGEALRLREPVALVPPQQPGVTAATLDRFAVQAGEV
jgi:hypothetical protein